MYIAMSALTLSVVSSATMWTRAATSTSAPRAPASRGLLRLREDEFGKDAAAKFGPQDHGIVYGQRLPVTMDTLRFLDEAEGRQYKRVAIDTQDDPAFACSYVGRDWAGQESIPGGDYLKHMRGLDAQDHVMDLDSAELPDEADAEEPET